MGKRNMQINEPEWLAPLLKLSLHPSKPSIARCYRMMLRKGYVMPTLHTVRKWVRRVPELIDANLRLVA